MKRTISFVLAVLIILASSIPTLASPLNVDKSLKNKYSGYKETISEEIVYVDDGFGNIVGVTFKHIRTYNSSVDSSGVKIMGWIPEHTVGYTDTFEVEITNEQMGTPSFVGSILSSIAKHKAARIAAKVLARKMGKLLPGLNLISLILSAFSFYNGYQGYNGIRISVDAVYSKYFYNYGGYFVYGWDIKNVDISRY